MYVFDLVMKEQKELNKKRTEKKVASPLDLSACIVCFHYILKEGVFISNIKVIVTSSFYWEY